MYLGIQNSLKPLCILMPEQEREDSKMIRKIIHIDEEKCNGCGLCAEACHEARAGELL